MRSLQGARIDLRDRPCGESAGASRRHLVAAIAQSIPVESAIQNALGVMHFAMPDKVEEVCWHPLILRGASSGESWRRQLGTDAGFGLKRPDSEKTAPDLLKEPSDINLKAKVVNR